MDKVYSTDNEIFNYDYDCAIDAAMFDAKTGDVVVIYEGEKEQVKSSRFVDIGLFIDAMNELAYEQFGEAAEDFATKISDDLLTELEIDIKNALDKWADKHNQHPGFYGVKNVKEIRIKVLDEDGDYWVLPDKQKD